MNDVERMATERLSLAGRMAVAQLADSNLDEMIAALGKGIAAAQFELDKTSVRAAQIMTGRYCADVDDDGRPILVERSSRVDFGGEKLSLLELGFTPMFYQFVDTILEVKVSISLDADLEIDRREHLREETKTKKVGFFKTKTKTTVHTVDTRFQASFQYSVEGSSYVRTTLVPVPPPNALLEILDQVVHEAQ